MINSNPFDQIVKLLHKVETQKDYLGIAGGINKGIADALVDKDCSQSVALFYVSMLKLYFDVETDCGTKDPYIKAQAWASQIETLKAGFDKFAVSA